MRTRQVAVLTLFGSLGGLLFGYDTGVVSGAMVLMRSQLSLSHSQQEAFVGIAILFAAFGSPIGAAMADRFGRKFVLASNAFLFLITSVILAISSKFVFLLLARAGIGLAVGSAAATTPMYLAECVPVHQRGSVVATYNLFVNGGQLAAAIIAGAFSRYDSGWRFMLGLAGVPALIQLIAVFCMLPESPLWLHQRVERLEFMVDTALEDSEMNSPTKSEDSNQARDDHLSGFNFRSFLGECFSSAPSAARRALFVGCFLQFIQQASGINTVMYYTGTLLADSGFGSGNAIWLNALVASFNFVFAFVGVFLMGKFSRRAVTLSSLFGVICSLILVVFAFAFGVKVLSVVSLCLYLACFASGMGPAPWTINAEIYPIYFRAAGAAASTITNWLTNFVVSSTFLSLIDATSKAGAFSVYAGIAAFGFLVLFKFLPETSNLEHSSGYSSIPMQTH